MHGLTIDLYSLSQEMVLQNFIKQAVGWLFTLLPHLDKQGIE